MKLTAKGSFFAVAGLAVACGVRAAAGPTALPLRSELGCIFNQQATQTIETNYGPSQAGLPFTQTTSYHFYSPPLASAASLADNDKAGATIAMKNTSTAPGNDFQAAGQISFYDYDPTTGTDVLVVSTPASGKQKVGHNTTAHWPVPNTDLPAAWTVAAGHLLHAVLTITLVSGNPGGFGQLVYDGPGTSDTTVALFPQNRLMAWNFGPLAPAPDATITTSVSTICPDACGNVAQVANVAGASYVWSVGNGTITAGQGTSQITWTAGSPGSVAVGVTITKGCTSMGTASVRVTGAAGTMVSVTPAANHSMSVVCSGTPGQVYQVQATTNLASPVWTSLGTATAGPDGLFTIVDAAAPNYVCRFYRTVSQ